MMAFVMMISLPYKSNALFWVTRSSAVSLPYTLHGWVCHVKPVFDARRRHWGVLSEFNACSRQVQGFWYTTGWLQLRFTATSSFLSFPPGSDSFSTFCACWHMFCIFPRISPYLSFLYVPRVPSRPSENDENTVTWNRSKPVAWIMLC